MEEFIGMAIGIFKNFGEWGKNLRNQKSLSLKVIYTTATIGCINID